jgi:hypothetical protein
MKRRWTCKAKLTVPAASKAMLTEETAALINLNDSQELFERADLRIRQIAVPFQIGLHPEYFPDFLIRDIRGLGDGALYDPAGVLEMRPNCKYLEALTSEAKSVVELAAEVRRRATALDEQTDESFAPLPVGFVQCHVQYSRLVAL